MAFPFPRHDQEGLGLARAPASCNRGAEVLRSPPHGLPLGAFLAFPSPPGRYRSLFHLLKVTHKSDLSPRSRAQESLGRRTRKIFVFGYKTSKSPFIMNSLTPIQGGEPSPLYAPLSLSRDPQSQGAQTLRCHPARFSEAFARLRCPEAKTPRLFPSPPGESSIPRKGPRRPGQRPPGAALRAGGSKSVASNKPFS